MKVIFLIVVRYSLQKLYHFNSCLVSCWVAVRAFSVVQAPPPLSPDLFPLPLSELRPLNTTRPLPAPTLLPASVPGTVNMGSAPPAPACCLPETV